MAKNKLDLRLEESSEPVKQNKPAEPAKKAAAEKKKEKTGPNFFQRIARKFREMISELKKVEWPPWQRTKNNPGVLANTGTVLVVVAFFLVVITAVDFGLAALLKLLTSI